MTETGNSRTALVLSHGDDAATAAVVRTLQDGGWRVIHTNGAAPIAEALTEPGLTVHGVAYLPGLLSSGGFPQKVEPAVSLLELVDAVQPYLVDRQDGGARVVVVGSRDWLGWPSRPLAAAQAAALVATVRSLALAHGPAGVTVNAVIGLLADAAQRREIGPARGTHLYEPVALTGEPVDADDIAAAVAFFLDDRSGYITGQVLHCCGGAGLLSSMSA
jgi:NAD(P)-dependent dehydrogenase (short-subunit alcohol dehydrogenase family)